MKPSTKAARRAQIFAREYVIDLNGTRAAIAAGYSAKGADVRGSALLAKSSVRKMIDELQTARASRLDITADKVVEELARLAFSNMEDFTRMECGKPILDMSGISRDQFAAVQEIREDATGGNGDGERKQVMRTTVKLADKGLNLERIGRFLGMFNDKLELSGSVKIADIVAERRKRVGIGDSRES